MSLGIFGEATTPDGFENGLGFQNYLIDGTSGNAGSLAGNNPWAMDWGQLGTVGKLGVISQGLGAFSNLANLYAGFKALSLQKKQFKFARDAWTKNYNNQLKDYENTLKDRWTARNAWAQNNNQSYESMGSWVGSRMPNGQDPNNNSAYRAQSPQGFYAATSAQENKRLPNSGGGAG